jgi:hypothetical protein
MEQKERCGLCAHWDSRPELEMASNVGYCDYHEKMFKSTYWCKYFLNKSSDEALQYKREIYGGSEDDDETEEMDG